MNNSQGRGLPFITLDDDGVFHISEEASGILSSRSRGKNGIAILCIAGAYRTGKSFLMNQIIGA